MMILIIYKEMIDHVRKQCDGTENTAESGGELVGAVSGDWVGRTAIGGSLGGESERKSCPRRFSCMA